MSAIAGWTLTTWVGMLGQCLVAGAIGRFIRERISARPLAALGPESWVPVLIVLLVPVDGLVLAGHLRGLWGDLSITTMAILLLYIAAPGALPRRPAIAWRYALVFLVAVPLYGAQFLPIPMMQRDAYELGWEPQPLLALIALAAASAALARRWCSRWALVAAAAMGGYALGFLESSNLWDYLVDPLFLLVIGWIAFFPNTCNPARPRAQTHPQETHP